MTDFNKTLFYCSQLYSLMSEGGTNPLEKYENALSELSRLSEIQDKTKKKDGERYLKRQVAIQNLMLELPELEKHKDDKTISKYAQNQLAKLYGYFMYKKWSVPTGEINPYTDKGVSVEADAIEMVGRLDGKKYVKNEQKFTNVYLSGIPDIIHDDYIIDIKNSYDASTFFINLHKDLLPAYWWQMQGYFYLTGLKRGEISFCLLPNSKQSIDLAVMEIMSKSDKYSELEIRNNLDYSNIPENERRIRFLINRDDDAISKIGEKITLCREFLTNLAQKRTEPRIATNDLLGQIDIHIQPEE